MTIMLAPDIAPDWGEINGDRQGREVAVEPARRCKIIHVDMDAYFRRFSKSAEQGGRSCVCKNARLKLSSRST
ncbi:MAG: hypothetical protein ACM3PD_09880 [Chloroflexota bacterium]